MQNYVFMTDSDSDLPLELKQQYDIPVVYSLTPWMAKSTSTTSASR